MLEMRDECEKCANRLAHHAQAYICSYECTFCPDCSEALGGICPNCGGEQVRRPRRAVKTESGS